MNEFFSKAVTLLNLKKNSYLLTDTISNDPISNIIEKYKNDPSIINIKENITQSRFSFREISLTEISNELININCKKSTTHNNIPPKVLKDTVDICSNVLHKLINSAIKDCVFPNKLKLADITPIFKKGNATDVKKQLAYYRKYLKYLRNFFIRKCQLILNNFYFRTYADAEKVSAHKKQF